jgi:hypothetical protein
MLLSFVRLSRTFSSPRLRLLAVACALARIPNAVERREGTASRLHAPGSGLRPRPRSREADNTTRHRPVGVLGGRESAPTPRSEGCAR